MGTASGLLFISHVPSLYQSFLALEGGQVRSAQVGCQLVKCKCEVLANLELTRVDIGYQNIDNQPIAIVSEIYTRLSVCGCI